MPTTSVGMAPGANGWETQEPMTTHYGMRQVYTKDPDGYELCFQHPVK